jgi:hypothetical protein
MHREQSVGSYTEKSTRYQVFERMALHAAESPRRNMPAVSMIHALFDAYFDNIEPVRQVIRVPAQGRRGEKKYEGAFAAGDLNQPFPAGRDARQLA